MIQTQTLQAACLVLETSREISLGVFTYDQADDLRHLIYRGFRDVPVCLSRDALQRIQHWLLDNTTRPVIDLTHPCHLCLEGKLAELHTIPVAA